MTGGDAAVKSLNKENVRHVFGLIGSATMEMFDALYHEKKIKFIGVRDERTGTHMADGYARASNKPGVIIAGQNGPGATNLVTGVAQAKAAFSPVIAIAGSYSTKDKMEDAFQGLDQQSLFTPITKKTWTIKNSKIIPNIMSDAFSLAMKPRRGPVCLNLPRNILAASNSYNINTKKPSFTNESKQKGNKENIKKAAKLIGASTCSVIIVGAGIKYNSRFKEVIKLAELCNLPIVTAAGHGDAIPFNHKLNAGQMGPRGNPVASKLVKNADVILAIGTRLGFNSTSEYITRDLNSGRFDFFCGGIAIPSRNVESESLLRKGSNGIEFFTTQVLYDSKKINKMLQHYNDICKKNKVVPRRILLSFAPVSSKKNIKFLKWLGVEIPVETEKRLNNENTDMTNESLEIAIEILNDILEYNEKNKINVPVGLNVEHIMSYNFQHSINMLQELSKTYREFCIKTSLYD